MEWLSTAGWSLGLPPALCDLRATHLGDHESKDGVRWSATPGEEFVVGADSLGEVYLLHRPCGWKLWEQETHRRSRQGQFTLPELLAVAEGHHCKHV